LSLFIASLIVVFVTVSTISFPRYDYQCEEYKQDVQETQLQQQQQQQHEQRHDNPPNGQYNHRNPQQQQQQRRRRRLEFVHIPKTAGTSIENAMSTQLNGRWGVCHFFDQQTSVRASKGSLSCPPPPQPHPRRHNDDNDNNSNAHGYGLYLPYKEFGSRIAPQFTNGCELWHVPSWLYTDRLPDAYNPYADADLFTVIRNPYDRIISEYYWKFTIESTTSPVLTVEHMNQWIQKVLSTRIQFVNTYYPWSQPSYCDNGGHYVPQYQFVYHPKDRHNTNNKPIIQHILRMESLSNDFATLMNVYNLSLTLPHVMKGKTSSASSSRKFNVQDLTVKTLQIIEKVYHQDFDAFNYTKLSPSLLSSKTNQR
jgi:hypothetical protein